MRHKCILSLVMASIMAMSALPAFAASTAIDPSSMDTMDAEETTQEDPAPVGQWVDFPMYFADDHMYHNVQVRVDGVTNITDNGDEIKNLIERSNDLGYTSEVDADRKLPSDVELHMVQYDVNIPDTLPADYSLYRLDLLMNVQDHDGGGIPSADGTSTYIGLDSPEYLVTEDFGEQGYATYKPGNMYTCYAVFPMVKGYKDYVFDCITGKAETKDSDEDNTIHVFFDSNGDGSGSILTQQTEESQNDDISPSLFHNDDGEKYTVTYSIDNGDKIDISVDTEDGYNLTAEVPFAVTKDGKTISQGTFIHGEFYDKYVSAAKEQGKILEQDDRSDISYIFYKVKTDGGDNYEYDYAIKVNGTDTGVVIGNQHSEKEAKEIFKKLSFSKAE